MRRLLSVALLATLAVNCAHGRVARPVGATRPIGAAAAQWVAVQTLRPGSWIVVTLFTRELIRGRLVTVDDQRIVISSEGAPVEVMRSRVQRVTMFTGVTRGTRAKRGFLVGAAAGALVAALTVESNRGPWMLMLSGGWGVLGALFSALDGSSRTATIIYEGSQSDDDLVGQTRPRLESWASRHIVKQ
jgi:hypothetical protein